MANQYRLIAILSTANGEEGIASLTDTIKAKIESGATIDTFDAIGTRELVLRLTHLMQSEHVSSLTRLMVRRTATMFRLYLLPIAFSLRNLSVFSRSLMV